MLDLKVAHDAAQHAGLYRKGGKHLVVRLQTGDRATRIDVPVRRFVYVELYGQLPSSCKVVQCCGGGGAGKARSTSGTTARHYVCVQPAHQAVCARDSSSATQSFDEKTTHSTVERALATRLCGEFPFDFRPDQRHDKRFTRFPTDDRHGVPADIVIRASGSELLRDAMKAFQSYASAEQQNVSFLLGDAKNNIREAVRFYLAKHYLQQRRFGLWTRVLDGYDTEQPFSLPSVYCALHTRCDKGSRKDRSHGHKKRRLR